MPRIWELPEIPSANGSRVAWITTVRHSITTTDYLVRVVKGRAPDITHGSWVRVSRLTELPLTGITRKILRPVKVIQRIASRMKRLPHVLRRLSSAALTTG